MDFIIIIKLCVCVCVCVRERERERERDRESAEGNHLAQGWFQWQPFIQMAKNLRVPQMLGHFLAN